MHLIRSNLDLKRLSCTADERRMKRLVHIRLWHGNIILKTPRNGLIHLMNHTQSPITVLHCVHHDSNRRQIINLIQSFILLHHLFIDAEKMLGPAVNCGLYSSLLHMVTHFFYNLLNEGIPRVFSLIYLLHQIIIDLWLYKFQR